jgi:hypothetical protein
MDVSGIGLGGKKTTEMRKGPFDRACPELGTPSTGSRCFGE